MSKQEFRLPFSGQVRQQAETSPARNGVSSSNLIEPKFVAANESGELTAEQRAKFKSMLPGLGSVLSSLSIFCLIGTVAAFFAYVIIVSPALRNWRNPAKAFAAVANTSSIFLIIVAVFAFMAAVLGLSFLKSLLVYLRARSILKPGAVRQAEGTILWSGKKYVASFPENKATLQTWNDCEIDVVIPGRHKFFYLPFEKTNWLLSIKRYPPDNEALMNLFRILTDANGFYADALESNRRGLLSQIQIQKATTGFNTEIAEGRVEMAEGTAEKILEKRFSGKKIKGMMADAAFDAAADIVFDAVLGTDTDNNNSSSDDNDNQEDTMMTYNYAYEIQDIRFNVSERSYDALIEGVQYRAYYLPHSKALVNIEPANVIKEF